MAAFVSYYLRILNARGEIVHSFAPAPLAELVREAAGRVADFDAYPTVYRVLKQTGGLYARPFLALPAPVVKGKRKQPAPPSGPFIVHLVASRLYHVPEEAAAATLPV